MNRGLIDYLTWTYSFLCKGRGILFPDDIRAIQNGANTMTRTAPIVLRDESRPAGKEAEVIQEEAEMITQHINECVDWLIRQEIV